MCSTYRIVYKKKKRPSGIAALTHTPAFQMATLAVVMALALRPVAALRDYRDNCIPNCFGQDDGSKVPDPLDCRQFYFCINNMPYLGPFQCLEGEVFDVNSGECVKGSSCDNICKNQCNYECKAPDIPAMISDRFDCGIYYECLSVDTPGWPRNCPQEKPFFDGFACQKEETECCSCQAYCSENDILSPVIDPVDCTKYYFCITDGFPDYSATCASGNFDLLSGKCSDTAPCITLCLNVVGPDGCIDIFTCEEVGYFAKCPQRCDPRYFRCLDTDVHHIIEADRCSSGYYYHPNTKHCVKRSDCPFPDPGLYTTATDHNINGTRPRITGAEGSSSSRLG